jgi:hypothetical protein
MVMFIVLLSVLYSGISDKVYWGHGGDEGTPGLRCYPSAVVRFIQFQAFVAGKDYKAVRCRKVWRVMIRGTFVGFLISP